MRGAYLQPLALIYTKLLHTVVVDHASIVVAALAV